MSPTTPRSSRQPRLVALLLTGALAAAAFAPAVLRAAPDADAPAATRSLFAEALFHTRLAGASDRGHQTRAMLGSAHESAERLERHRR